MSTPALALEWNHSQCSPPSRSSCTHALPRQRGMRTSCMLNVSAVAAHGGWGTRSDSSWHPRHSGATNRAAGEDPTQAAANFLRKSAAAGHWAPAAWLQPTQQSCSGRKMRHCLADPLRQAAGQFPASGCGSFAVKIASPGCVCGRSHDPHRERRDITMKVGKSQT